MKFLSPIKMKLYEVVTCVDLDKLWSDIVVYTVHIETGQFSIDP